MTCNKHSFFVHYMLEYFICLFVLLILWLREASFKAHAHIVRGSAFTIAIGCNRSLRRCKSTILPLFLSGPRSIGNLASLDPYVKTRNQPRPISRDASWTRHRMFWEKAETLIPEFFRRFSWSSITISKRRVSSQVTVSILEIAVRERWQTIPITRG